MKNLFKGTCLVHTTDKDYWIDSQSAVIEKVMRNWQFIKVPTLELVEKDKKIEIKRDICWLKSAEINQIEDYDTFSHHLERLLENHERRIAEEI